MTISFSSLNTKNIIRHDQESVEGVSIIHPKSSKYPPGCLQDSRGLATCEPLRRPGALPPDSGGIATCEPLQTTNYNAPYQKHPCAIFIKYAIIRYRIFDENGKEVRRMSAIVLTTASFLLSILPPTCIQYLAFRPILQEPQKSLSLIHI